MQTLHAANIRKGRQSRPERLRVLDRHEHVVAIEQRNSVVDVQSAVRIELRRHERIVDHLGKCVEQRLRDHRAVVSGVPLVARKLGPLRVRRCCRCERDRHRK